MAWKSRLLTWVSPGFIPPRYLDKGVIDVESDSYVDFGMDLTGAQWLEYGCSCMVYVSCTGVVRVAINILMSRRKAVTRIISKGLVIGTFVSDMDSGIKHVLSTDGTELCSAVDLLE
ncbi:hypothetical protein HGM15179_002950 [Zosterops borbonicus]|uniref:Uncharacterized protein n=1 Tax=Zosterops borbonicus TaxID=364589 RepID=A0A8K1GUW5_9PASS|nr:hypothetical protein HGM15179_002950 [Zosterops borbonicus]